MQSSEVPYMEAICTMARTQKKAEPADNDAPGTTLLRINIDLATKIVAVVNWKTRKKKLTVAQYLDPILREVVEVDFATVLEEMSAVSSPAKRRS